jgi:hypothetical protein
LSWAYFSLFYLVVSGEVAEGSFPVDSVVEVLAETAAIPEASADLVEAVEISGAEAPQEIGNDRLLKG